MAVRATDFQIPKITHEEINENHGVFAIEPLDRGARCGGRAHPSER